MKTAEQGRMGTAGVMKLSLRRFCGWRRMTMTQARVVARVRSRRRTDHASPLPISSSANTSNKQTLSSDRESKPDKNSIYISQKTSNWKSNDAPFHTHSLTNENNDGLCGAFVGHGVVARKAQTQPQHLRVTLHHRHLGIELL